ncbi:MAG: CsbD family protein [Erysipelothrix sp.]|jgi:uncharacterized protein YjbJ (UPF0337 family)|nr:CsbD family protein [Erysipelothrix sp.]
MEKFNKNVQIKSDKLAGKTKEVIGKVTNNKELEIKGKVQSTMADIDQKATDLKNDASKKMKDMKNHR